MQSRRQHLQILRNSCSFIMTELGWTPIRARGLNRSGYRDQVRGWARDRSGESACCRSLSMPLAEYYSTPLIRSVSVKNMLRDIQTDYANL